MERKYGLPDFLVGILDQESYERWLRRKAAGHCKRDRKRGNVSISQELYRLAIHHAVVRSGGLDEYTGEKLNWQLVSTYNNDQSKAERRAYKKALGDLPTVDHVGDGMGAAEFKMCSWRVNDAKNDLTYDEFLQLCTDVLRFSGRIDGTGVQQRLA